MSFKTKIKNKISLYTYKCLKNIYHKNASMTPEEARSILNNKWEKNSATCIGSNTCKTPYEFDLQIIIPAYNMEKYIEECLDSVVNQKTKYKYVVYVIDDGSKDKTLQKLEKYTGNCKVNIISKENGGVSSARNTGFSKIVASHIMFIDSDDYLAEGAIEALMDKAIETDADIVSGGHERLIDGKKVLYNHYNVDRYVDDYSKIPGMPWGKVYKSELLENVIFPEKYWYEDTIIRFMLLNRAKDIYYINKSVYIYRILKDSASHSNEGNPRNIESYWLTEIIVNDYKKSGFPITDRTLNSILKQSVINDHRVSSLGRDVEEAVFVLTREIIKSVFPEEILLQNHNSILKYFMSNDFGGYKVYCKANK